MFNEKNLEEIKVMLNHKCGVSKDKTSINSELEDDLGLTGDDAVEFISDFSRKFNVDISNFVVSDYFSNESLDFIGSIINFFKRKEVIIKKRLTVGDLVRIIEIGKMDDEIINKLINITE